MDSSPLLYRNTLKFLDHRLEALPSPGLSPLTLAGGEGAKLTKRQKIVKEMFESEQSYISQLKTIITLFLEPIRVRGLLPSDATNAVFNNVEGILAVNMELLRSMKQRSLGEAFSALGPFLKLYASYSSNFQSAIETLEMLLKTNSQFASFIIAQEARPECCSLKLAALLITPVQRIPRYKLLLEDLLRHTKETHMDYSKINAATQQIIAVASHINEYIRQHENAQKMLTIQNRLTGNFVPGIIAPGRKFIREGKLMKICRRKIKKRTVFLFSDMFLYVRSHFLDIMTESYIYCGLVPLLNSSIQIILSDARAPDISTLLKITSEDTSLTFFSQNDHETADWAQLIEDTIRELQESYISLTQPESQKGRQLHEHTLTLGRVPLSPIENYPLTPHTPISNLAAFPHLSSNAGVVATVPDITMEHAPTIPHVLRFEDDENDMPHQDSQTPQLNTLENDNGGNGRCTAQLERRGEEESSLLLHESKRETNSISNTSILSVGHEAQTKCCSIS